MIDEYSGLEVRKTVNGMRGTDDKGIAAPPQHRRVLTDEEIVGLIAAAPQVPAAVPAARAAQRDGAEGRDAGDWE